MSARKPVAVSAPLARALADLPKVEQRYGIALDNRERDDRPATRRAERQAEKALSACEEIIIKFRARSVPDLAAKLDCLWKLMTPSKSAFIDDRLLATIRSDAKRLAKPSGRRK